MLQGTESSKPLLPKTEKPEDHKLRDLVITSALSIFWFIFIATVFGFIVGTVVGSFIQESIGDKLVALTTNMGDLQEQLHAFQEPGNLRGPYYPLEYEEGFFL